jgi:hypothetical protein
MEDRFSPFDIIELTDSEITDDRRDSSTVSSSCGNEEDQLLDKLLSESNATGRPVGDTGTASIINLSRWEQMQRDPNCVEVPAGTPLDVFIPGASQ